MAYHTTRLRLEVETAPALPNLVKNPVAGYGTWGYITPSATTTIGPVNGFGIYPGAMGFTVYSGPGYFQTELMPVAAGRYISASLAMGNIEPSHNLRMRFNYYSADRTFLSSSTQSAGFTATGSRLYHGGSIQTPANTAYVQLEIGLYSGTGTAQATAGAGFSVSGVMVTHSASTISSSYAYNDNVAWVDVLGSTYNIEVDRNDFDLGTLDVSIKGPALDPATNSLIAVGKQVRVMADAVIAGGTYSQSVMTGRILDATTTYNNDNTVTVSVSATDNMTHLSNQAEKRVVSTLTDLTYLLEGKGAPWKVNGSGNQPAGSPTVVAVNEEASIVDQVFITRDSNLGAVAFIDRRNILNVASPVNTPVATFSDAAGAPLSYINLDRSFSLTDCINQVNVNFLRYNVGTGETTEAPYGPFTDQTSVERYGAFAKTFTIAGPSTQDNNAYAASFAAQVLTANATPAVRINSLTYKVKDEPTQTQAVLIDLYSVITVVRNGVSTNVRVTSIKHTITAFDWTVTYGFTTTSSVPAPTVVPSPPVGTVVTGSNWAVSCTATTSITGTALVDLPGMSQTLVSGTNDAFLINVTLDSTNVSGTAVQTGTLYVDGTLQNGAIVYRPGVTGARATVSQTFIVTPGAGSHTFAVKSNLTATGSTYSVASGLSTMTIVRL